jgi:hypothetical protein
MRWRGKLLRLWDGLMYKLHGRYCYGGLDRMVTHGMNARGVWTEIRRQGE